MSENKNSQAKDRRSKARALGAFIVIIFVGPTLGTLLAMYGVVLSPPTTILTGGLYVLLAGLGLPLGIAAILLKWFRIRTLVLALLVGGIVSVFYLALIGPWLPGGMTDCQVAAADLPRVRYECVSTSSDSPSYRREFMLEGQAGWPLMRLVDSEL